MGTPKSPIPKEILELYDSLIASYPDIERKGKTTPYTSANGYMFTFLSNEGRMGIRLPKERRELFIHTYDTGLMEQYGRVMKEFVEVPDGLLKDKKVITPLIQKSLEYVMSLKPK
jgi:hypothetical protein